MTKTKLVSGTFLRELNKLHSNYIEDGICPDKQKNGRKIMNILLYISFNICYGCSKEPSH